ncbi:hypothetical protein EP7_000253 [Isosphaeraceae bacterium EP7]
MKHLLRRGIERLPAPLPLVLQDAFRYARYPQVRRRRKAHRRIVGRLATPDRVAQGPFRGMRPIAAAYCSEFLPKLVGTYEREIAPAIEAICAAGCDRIVDIGAAEGYYAVGMAMRNPDALVVGFEMNPSARYYLRQLAERNEVSARLQIRGTCDLDSLAASLEGARRPALICDCEGAEDLLLDPVRVEPLRRSYVLVETHDGLATDAGVLEGIGRRLHERFGATHAIETIDSRPRSGDDLPAGTELSPEESAEAMNEGRPWAQWLFMTPTA